MPEFILGVNYWPRKKAMYWWEDFSRAEVDAEFAEIASYHWTPVRIFLPWEVFQPAPDEVSRAALSALGTVLDTALAHRLQVIPTFFMGHMSGLGFWSAWALCEGIATDGLLRMARGQITAQVPRDPYHDPFLLAAQADLVRAVCTRFAQHSAIWGWDLANEPDNFAVPESYAAGMAWHRTLAGVVRSSASQPLTCGLHLESLTGPYRGFRPDLVGTDEDVLSMHAYSTYYRPTAQTDPLCSDIAPLAVMASAALGGKPALCEEFGCAVAPDGQDSYFKWTGVGPLAGPQYFADEAGAARHYSEVLEKLRRVGAMGALAWQFSDPDPSLHALPPFDQFEHERYFGLTRADGTLKAHGAVYADWAWQAAHDALPPAGSIDLVLDAHDWYVDPGASFAHLLQTWRGRLWSGTHD